MRSQTCHAGALFAFALIAAPTTFAAPQGSNIGDPTGRFGLWPLLQSPPGNKFVSDPANDYRPLPGSYTEQKYLLGKALFWDEQVSSDNTMACGTCHFPETAGIDPRGSFQNPQNGRGSLGTLPQDAANKYVAGTPTSQQDQVTPIIAPSMLGAAFAEILLWDVAAGPNFTFASGLPITLFGVDQFPTFAALEAQSVGPVQNSIEMAHAGLVWNTGAIENKLGRAFPLALASAASIPADLAPMVGSGQPYARIFDTIFNADPVVGGFVGVTRERFALAVATYERTLIPNQAPIDTRPLNVREMAGFNHLVGSACFRCHSDPGTPGPPALTGFGGFVDAMDAMLTDNQRHPGIGFPSQPGATGKAQGNFGVKTPSLRNVMLKTNWSHNGFFTTIDQLLQFYNRELPFLPAFPFVTGSLPGGQLTAIEKDEVKAFFRSLTDARLIPPGPGLPLGVPFDRPDLYSERFPLSAIELPGYNGTPAPLGTSIPDIIADPPLLTTASHFKIGVRDSAPSATAILLTSPNALPGVIPPGPLMLNSTGLMNFVTTTDPNGFATLSPLFAFVLPPGTAISAQWAVLDSGGGGFAWSNAAEYIVQ